MANSKIKALRSYINLKGKVVRWQSRLAGARCQGFDSSCKQEQRLNTQLITGCGPTL